MSNQADFDNYMQAVQDEVKDSIETQLPAEIVSYDHTQRMATVKILSLPEYDTMCYRDIPPCQEIPVATLCSGGFLIHSPLKAGDTGYVSFFSKEIDEYKNTGGEHLVDGNSSFDYHNVMFHPTLHPFNKEMLGTHENNLVIGSQDGSLTLEMTPEKEILINQDGIQRLKLNSDGSIDVLATTININANDTTINTSKLTVNGATEINGSTTINGATTITNTLDVTSSINAGGSIESGGSITSAGAITGMSVQDILGPMTAMRLTYNSHNHSITNQGISPALQPMV